MERVYIDCQNEKCVSTFHIDIESEDCGVDSQNVAQCPTCLKQTFYKIDYIITANDFELVE